MRNEEELYDKRLDRKEEKLNSRHRELDRKQQAIDESRGNLKNEEAIIKKLMKDVEVQNLSLNSKASLIADSYLRLNAEIDKNDAREHEFIEREVKIGKLLQSINEREKTYEMEGLELKVKQKEISRREKLISLNSQLNA